MSVISEFYPMFEQKGYTEREIRQSMEAAISQEVPAQFKDRYETYAEYQEALHDFLNGI
tara:strand:+ start:184 stop:360 length:177 start_codon:yes stop_codon:yes gene_type:complete